MNWDHFAIIGDRCVFLIAVIGFVFLWVIGA